MEYPKPYTPEYYEYFEKMKREDFENKNKLIRTIFNSGE
jgi:hypothetical protein